MSDISKFPAVQFREEKTEYQDNDVVIFSGELMWVKTDPKFCKKGEKLTCSIKLPQKEYQKLTKLKVEGKRKLCGLKKVMKKDEDGDETDELDYYQVTVTQRPYVKDKKTGEEKAVEIPVRMFNDKDTQVEVGVGNGSTGRVRATLWDSTFGDKKQESLNLSAIQIFDLIPFGTGGSSDNGPLSDFSFEDAAPSFDQEEEETTQESQEDDDFDNEDTPF